MLRNGTETAREIQQNFVICRASGRLRGEGRPRRGSSRFRAAEGAIAAQAVARAGVAGRPVCLSID